MNCTRFEQLVQDVPRKSERAQVVATLAWREHLAECPDCANARSDDQLLQQVLDAQTLPQPSSGLAGRILNTWSIELQNAQHVKASPARIERSRFHLSGVRQRLAVLTAGLAACALLILQGPLRNSFSEFPLGTALVQQQSDLKDEQSLLSSVRGVYQSVAKASLEAPQFVPPSVEAVLPEYTVSVNSDLAEINSQEMLKPLTELKDELHPLGEKVSRAVGFLWKTIPADESL